MSRLRVNAFGISIDGYGAGPGQDLANPMGVGGMALHQWVFGTKTFQKMHGDFAGSLIGDNVGREGVDDDFAARDRGDPFDKSAVAERLPMMCGENERNLLRLDTNVQYGERDKALGDEIGHTI